MGVFRHFPYSNFHEMNMDEIIKIVKNMLEEWAQYYTTWDNWKEQVTQEWAEMQDFINNYFDNLDVQTEINNKITSMVNSGEFSQIVDPYVPPAVSAWLAEHVTTSETVVIDDTLTIAGAAADSKTTGDAIKDVKHSIDDIMDYSENRFDPSDYIDNSTIDGSGNITPSTDTWVSGEIKVPEGATHVILSFLNSLGVKTLVTTSTTRICFYGKNGYITRSASTDVDLANGTTYIRFIIANTYSKNQVMIEFNATMSADFVPYRDTIKPSLIVVDKTLTEEDIPADAKAVGDVLGNIENNINSLFKENQTIKVNYFNPDTVTMDKNIDSSGYVQTAVGSCISDRIYIPAGKTKAVISYTATDGSQSLPSSFVRVGAYYYTEDGTHITGRYGAHDIPSGAVYAVLTMNSTYAANAPRRRIMYEFAETTSGFFPYTDITNYIGDVEKQHFNFLSELVNNAPQIKLIGDSVTQGVGGTGFAQDGELIFSDGGSNTWSVNTNGYCWANLFKAHIESLFDATVKNWGCRGVSCMDVFALNMLPTLIEEDDDIVIVMLGTNDRNDTQMAPDNADLMYQMNLKAICNYIIQQGKKLILISPIPATPTADTETGVNFGSNTVNAICTSVAEQIGCEYFNLSKEMVNWILSTGGTYSSLYSDILHPNDKGYELIYYLICKGLNIPNDWTFTFTH